MSLPIVCSLTDSELQERRRGVLQKVLSAVVEVRELEDGYSYSFPADGDSLIELARLVDLERQCCPFIQFSITVGPDAPIWLQMTGPQGSKEFIAATFTSKPVS